MEKNVKNAWKAFNQLPKLQHQIEVLTAEVADAITLENQAREQADYIAGQLKWVCKERDRLLTMLDKKDVELALLKKPVWKRWFS